MHTIAHNSTAIGPISKIRSPSCSASKVTSVEYKSDSETPTSYFDDATKSAQISQTKRIQNLKITLRHSPECGRPTNHISELGSIAPHLTTIDCLRPFVTIVLPFGFDVSALSALALQSVCVLQTHTPVFSSLKKNSAHPVQSLDIHLPVARCPHHLLKNEPTYSPSKLKDCFTETALWLCGSGSRCGGFDTVDSSS